MNHSDYVIGRLLLIGLLPWASAIWATRKYHWFEARWLDLSIRIQTAFLTVIFVAQAFGSTGLFNTAAVLASPCIYVLLTLSYATRYSALPEPVPVKQQAEPGSKLVLGLIIFVVMMTFGKLFMPSLIGAPKVVSDGPIYHLYFAARWWLEHKISWIPIPFGENGAPYFPANGDLWFMTLTAWTGNLAIAKVGQVPFWFLGGFWLFHLCRRLSADTAAAGLAAAIWMTITPLALFTFEANVDTIFAAWFIASVLFYVEYDIRKSQADSLKSTDHFLNSSNRLLLIHSLMAAGLAWGTKAPGIVFIPPWILWISLKESCCKSPSELKLRLAEFIRIWLITCVPVAYWWVRNTLATGNPIYPLPVTIFGLTLLDGWYGPDVMKLSPYYIPVENWGAFIDQFAAVADIRLVPVYLVATLYTSYCYRKNKVIELRWVSQLAAFGCLSVTIYWLLVPYRTQQRFFLHAMAMFAPAIALLANRTKILLYSINALLFLHLTTTQGWPLVSSGKEPFWDLSRIVPNSVPGLVPAGELLARMLTGDLRPLISLVLSLSTCVVWLSGMRKLRILGFSSAISALILLGFMENRQFERQGRGLNFPIFPDYERAWNALDSVTRKSPKSIAYSGTNLALYLMGRDLKNRVEYVNCDQNTNWMPHDYHLSLPVKDRRWPDPRPTWERLGPDYSSWLKNLEIRKIDLVVVARANPNEGRLNPYDDMGFPIERSWMIMHPERFEPVYGVRENDPEMQIFAVIHEVSPLRQ